jgi:ribosomal protein S18 acetylase RimI-like enzyme
MTSALRHTVNTSAEADIFGHLAACDEAFVPPLRERVDLAAYAQKLAQRALRVEAWKGKRLVGLVAAYLDADRTTCFVSNVSVLPAFSRHGIARGLLERLVAQTDRCDLRLEVSRRNTAALALYDRLGFVVGAETGDTLTLVRSRTSSRAPPQSP